MKIKMRKIKQYKNFLEMKVYLGDTKTKLDGDFDKIIEIIKRDCKPFLDTLKRENVYCEMVNPASRPQALYRGVPTKGDVIERCEIDGKINILYKKSSRKDRRSKDLGGFFTRLFDSIFEFRYHISPRSQGIFTTSLWSTARAYSGMKGGTYLFFPIGDYKMVWSEEVDDLFSALEGEYFFEAIKKYPTIDDDMIDQIKNGKTYTGGYDHLIGESIDVIVDDLKQMSYDRIGDLVSEYQLDNLYDALRSENEITFICDEYYLVDFNSRIIEEFYQNIDPSLIQ